jgi:catechol 2,3-dioxygenase-like lactoylglutathione lyase family enzyme
MTVRLSALRCGDAAEAWEAIGFAVDAGGRIALANGAIELTGDGRGLTGLVVDGELGAPAEIEGIPIDRAPIVPGRDHPNGAFELDHVVVRTPDLETTSGVVADVLGLELRRIRETETVRQGFHRFPDQGGVRGCIVEVVDDGRATETGLWGLVVNVEDLDAVVERLGPDLIGPPKPAVQAGRGIATIRRAAGLGVPLALMSPA